MSAAPLPRPDKSPQSGTIPRPDQHGPKSEDLAGGSCKIRKRGCSSSSSSSSVLRRYRLKRAILVVGRRAGASTPVPTWPINARSPGTSAEMSNCSRLLAPVGGGRAKQAPVSARKLATALWELQGIPSSQVTGNSKEETSSRRGGRDSRGRAKGTESLQSGSLTLHFPDSSHSPNSETMVQSGSGSRHRQGPSVVSRKLRLNECNHGAPGSLVDCSSLESDTTHCRGLAATSSVVKVRNRLRDLSNSLMASNELLMILSRIWGLEERHSSSISLVSALRSELARARAKVNQLGEDRQSVQSEIKRLKTRLMEEKSAWRRREEERVAFVTGSMIEELGFEKKRRRRSERLLRRLEVELAEAKSALGTAMMELEGERRSRENIEHVCVELVRGIGKDKAQVEELRKESARALEELEKEREMLQLADMWREERVQMKLSEAKHHFEEKNAAVDQLRNELEVFLATSSNNNCNLLKEGGKSVKELEEEGAAGGGQLTAALLDKYCFSGRHMSGDGKNEQKGVGVEHVGNAGEEEDDDGAESADSDLHSIELNLEENGRNYRAWNYISGDHGAQSSGRSLAFSMGANHMGRSSNYLKIAGSSFSIDRGELGGNELQNVDIGSIRANRQHRDQLVGAVGQEVEPSVSRKCLGPKKKQTSWQSDSDAEISYEPGEGRHRVSAGSCMRSTSPGGLTARLHWILRPHAASSSLDEDGEQDLCGADGDGFDVAEVMRALIREGGFAGRAAISGEKR